MVKNIHLFTFLLLSWQTWAQGLNAERAFQDDYHQTVSAVACEGVYNYSAIKVHYQGTYFSRSLLQKRTESGDLVWSQEVLPFMGESVQVDALQLGANGDLLLSGYIHPTCDVLSECLVFAARYDQNGILLWSKMVTDSLCDASVSLTGISSYKNDHALFTVTSPQGNTLLELDAFGQEVFSRPLPISNMPEFVSSVDSVVYSFQGQTIYRLSMNGGIDANVVLANPIIDIAIRNDSLFVLTNSRFILLTEDLQNELMNVPTGTFNNSDLKITGNSIRFADRDAAGVSVNSLDLATQLITQQYFETDLEVISHFDFDSSLTVVESYSMAENTEIRWRNYQFSGTAQLFERPDIGVIAVDIAESSIEPVVNGPFEVVEVLYKPTVLIKNWGTEPMSNCVINIPLSMGFCNANYYNVEFPVALAAGDSVWQETVWFSEILYFPDSMVEIDVCAYTSNPNGLVDLNVLNDRTCNTIVLGKLETTSIASAPVIDVYPNPSTGKISLNLPEAATVHFSLYSLSGRLLETGTSSKNMDFSAYPSGSYFLYLQTENGMESMVKLLLE